MPLFEETQSALGEFAASQQYDFGTHSALQLKSGVPGTDVGEFAFDPAKHSPADIYPFSLMEMATGIPHVRMVIPDRPLEANIIVHNDLQARDDPRLVAMKQSLASDLRQDIEDALPGITDKPMLFNTGTTPEEAGIEQIGVEADLPATNAHNIAELCTEGLSFVISDFRRLPLEKVASDYLSTVAIKVNHIAEMELPANVGVISLGETAEVNTNKPKELAEFNAELAQQHETIIARLESAGIAVAQVVFDRRNNPQFGFDVTSADAQIAAAVNRVEA